MHHSPILPILLSSFLDMCPYLSIICLWMCMEIPMFPYTHRCGTFSWRQVFSAATFGWHNWVILHLCPLHWEFWEQNAPHIAQMLSCSMAWKLCLSMQCFPSVDVFLSAQNSCSNASVDTTFKKIVLLYSKCCWVELKLIKNLLMSE